MPEFTQLGDTSLISPEVHILDEDESDLNEYPTDPVVCVPDQDDPEYWSLLEVRMRVSLVDQDRP